MPYDFFIDPQAAARVAQLPPYLQAALADHLHLLCESPVSLSRPAPSPPYRFGYQMYQFDFLRGDKLHYVTVLFKYMADEKTLWIGGVGHMERDAPI